jgi:hypothetical protein
MNERGQYGKRAERWQYSRETHVGESSPVRTFFTGALVGGVLMGVAVLTLRHVVIKQQELVAGINRYRPGAAT